MRQALKEAQKAYKQEEVPVGVVIVKNNEIISKAHNIKEKTHNPCGHAEILAIEKATKKIEDWRLEDCTLYVTLEPCQMCAGAIVQARMKRVVSGAMNPKAGCAGSILNLLQVPKFNHQVEFEHGVLEEECSNLLQSFFKTLRKQKSKEIRRFKIFF